MEVAYHPHLLSGHKNSSSICCFNVEKNTLTKVKLNVPADWCYDADSVKHHLIIAFM